jgi:hypothetical protein
MRRSFLTAAVVLLTLTPLAAVDAIGTILRIDLEKGWLFMYAGGQNRAVRLDKEVKVLDRDGKALPGGITATELREGVEVTVTLEGEGNEHVIKVIRIGRAVDTYDRPSVGLKPLTEMTAADGYKGEDGGLYGGGRNDPPPAHLQAARRETARIEPLEADGRPAKEGTIALVSISMSPPVRAGRAGSNATQEFSVFNQLADKDTMKSPRLTIVDCVQGGQGMAQWVDPQGRAWLEADRRLQTAGVTPQQVQVVWVKLANIQPAGELTEHGRKLQRDTVIVLQNAKARFPNLRIAYLGSRIYGGWTTIPLNPEPYAYEGAFVVRWLIQDQIKGDPGLNFDPSEGAVKAPLLLWGPYLWADGTTPRKADGLIYERKDLLEDGTFPSDSGQRKVADMLLAFFRTDPLARTWYSRN